MTTRKIAVKIPSRMSGTDVRDARSGLRDPGRDGVLADRDHDDGRGADRADDLGEDVADGLDRRSVRLSRTMAIVTAGLKCPPDMWPKATIAASRPRPNENGTTSRFGVAGDASPMAATDA